MRMMQPGDMESEMVRAADAMRCTGEMMMHSMRISAHEVQARWTIWTSSSTEGAGALDA